MFNTIRLKRPEAERFRQGEELRFLAYVFCKRAESEAQILQDLWVCYELGERHGGFFAEFGATNGLVNSNTWLLENKYGWGGFLAEPNPIWHAALAINRPSRIDHRCVSSSPGKTVSFLVTNDADPELSAIAEFADGAHFADVRAKAEKIEVETISLNDLLSNDAAPIDIDYLSIDTEGSEYDILSRLDFFETQDLTHLGRAEPKTESDIESLLVTQGCERVFDEHLQWDGWCRRVGSRSA
ncbi:MAG: FkbM family methyltransferase [Hyphomonadaceae bacterium]|nr:FkbM family methyltransferase [Hyphomonadaceae bacterium]